MKCFNIFCSKKQCKFVGHSVHKVMCKMSIECHKMFTMSSNQFLDDIVPISQNLCIYYDPRNHQ